MNGYQIGFNPIYAEQAPSIEDLQALTQPAILEFGAPWCPHCQAAEPVVNKALDTVVDIAHIKVFDGKGKRLGRAFNVKLWPTLILLRQGQEVARIVRPTTVEDVKRLLESISL
ncbi:thioredoxin family protein [Vibrio gallicus]|uniref:thioredoxin family protein n=1 Tax=Vibrio gallicus TaxID=190897 RepID=UPI0021C4AF57|nr:thioredoxin family protein [Vibrio gallicus]